MPRPLALALAATFTLAGTAGCGADRQGDGYSKTTASGSGHATSSRATASHATTASTPPPAPRPRQVSCKRVPAPRPRTAEKLPAPTNRLDAGATWLVNVATSCGTFAITLDVKRAPKTTSSFAWLVRLGFYDGLTFHRVVPGDLVQGGDPRGDGSGGPGYHTVERPPGNLRYTRGIVAMGKTEIDDPGTAGSQFFIVTGPDAQLDPDYALVGRVTSGMDTVDRIAVLPADPNTDAPQQPVVIDSMRVVQVKGR